MEATTFVLPEDRAEFEAWHALKYFAVEPSYYHPGSLVLARLEAWEAARDLLASKHAEPALMLDLPDVEVPDEPGWICEHPRYGRWFISRKAVMNDLNNYRNDYGDEPESDIMSSDVDSWWVEQCGWPEVYDAGVQLARPNMAMHEALFKKAMGADGSRDGLPDADNLASKDQAK